MKDSRSCHTCQRHYYNLMNATCGHKICFNCVKSNKNSHKCSFCAHQPKSKSFLSPSRNVSQDPKERSTKIKDSESKNGSEYSPAIWNKSRPSFHRSSMGMQQLDNVQQSMSTSMPVLACKQHHQPLSMYCRSAKQLMCSVCICNQSKHNDVMPLRMAEEHLRKENKLNKEESKIILGNIQNSHKIISRNIDIFKNTYQGSLRSIEQFFQEIHRQAENAEKNAKQELGRYFENKLKECQQIKTDLDYLNQILRQFKDNIKENCTFHEHVYLFSSFKVIKGTIKNLDIDYFPYSKEPSILEITRGTIRQNLKNCIRLHLDLPLKFGQRRKNKSQSNKSAKHSRNEEWDEIHRGGYTGKLNQKQRGSITKKHQQSLCNNIHGIEFCEQERNLYKMLLKTKFKL